MNWNNIQNLNSISYTCGYCGNPVASEKGYSSNFVVQRNIIRKGEIYICHHCDKPTYFDESKSQIPGAKFVGNIEHIPDEDIRELFEEANSCYSINAFTSAVMCCRKLLMSISVAEKAKEGLSFAQYVNFLNDNNYIPPNGKEWVDSIRKLGNEANHKIELKKQDDAKTILIFTEMLLRFIYELPGMMKSKNK